MDTALVQAAARVGARRKRHREGDSETSARSSGRPVAAAWETWLQYGNRILRPRRRQPQPKAAARARTGRGTSMSFVLALDQGTTSSRALLFDHAGAVRAVAQAEFRQIFPQPGWVEHDAAEIWATQSGVMHEVLAKAGLGARDVAAIGITNQRETTVLWDRASGSARRPRHRLAGPPHGAALRRAARRRPRRADRAQDGARARRLLFGHQAQVAARQRSGRASPRDEGRARLRHHRLVARLEPDARRGARDRSVEREPHAAVRHPQRRRGTTSCSRSSTYRAAYFRASCRRRRFAATRASPASTCRSRASRATSRRRSSARPATRPGSRRTPTAPAASC